MAFDNVPPIDSPKHSRPPDGDQDNVYDEINKALDTGFSLPGQADSKLPAGAPVNENEIVFGNVDYGKLGTTDKAAGDPTSPETKKLELVQTGLAALLDNNAYHPEIQDKDGKGRKEREQLKRALLAFGSKEKAADFLAGGADQLSIFTTAPALKKILEEHGLESHVIYKTGKVEATILCLAGQEDKGLRTRFEYTTVNGKAVPRVAGVDVVSLKANDKATSTDIVAGLNLVSVVDNSAKTDEESMKQMQAQIQDKVLAHLAHGGQENNISQPGNLTGFFKDRLEKVATKLMANFAPAGEALSEFKADIYTLRDDLNKTVEKTRQKAKTLGPALVGIEEQTRGQLLKLLSDKASYYKKFFQSQTKDSEPKAEK